MQRTPCAPSRASARRVLVARATAGCIVSAALFGAGGCATPDASTAEPPRSAPVAPVAPSSPPEPAARAEVRAPSGAVAGWISGDDIRERRRRALLGLGVAGLAGGEVGRYVDTQETRLRQRLQGTGVSVTRLGDNVTLHVPGSVAFTTDSSSLQAAAHAVLDAIALVLQEYDRTIVEVAGHTDDTGADAYNQALSERRAGTVAQYLRGRGVRPQRLVTVGAGESRPIATNETPEGRRQNRRVELTLVPLTVE